MNIFIDTNVYLSFYHLSSDDLEELKKLAVLVREGKITFLLTDQVMDEFHRNRAAKIADALKRVREQRRSLQLPQIAKQYDEYKRLRDAQAELDNQLGALLERIEADVANGTLEADAVIGELFQVARKISTTDEALSRAKLRVELVRPPGKKGSLGDAVNWELLLATVPQGEDLYFVSDDADYTSPLNEDQIHPYLEDEWNEAIKSSVHFYRRLSALFRERFPDIRLASELEKELLIQRLAESPNFLTTHSIIAKLGRYSDFNNAQLNALVTAAVTNNQVYWIAKDPDIYAFFTSLLSGRENLVDPDNLRRLKYALGELEPYHDFPF